MKVEALVNFCGVLSMVKGEVRECNNEIALANLIAAGYIKEVRADPDQKKTTPKRSVKKNESQRD